MICLVAQFSENLEQYLFYIYSNNQSIVIIASLQQILLMSCKNMVKNYYSILGVPADASLFEIQQAYEKLAAQNHPDKHKHHRKHFEDKFHLISEAFEVLSDANKRAHYNDILVKEYSLCDAETTFDQFFNEHGIIDETEKQFFATHYPSSFNTYYTILGVPSTATLEEIKNAYRKKALQYHPKKNANDEEAHKKFIEVNEAYKALQNEFKKENYDNIMFGAIQPIKAHSIFDDFFSNRLWNTDISEEFRPIIHSKWSRDIDRLMLDENSEVPTEGQTVKTSKVWSNTNGQQTEKTVTSKKQIKNGKAEEEITQVYCFPNGQKTVTKTLVKDGKIDCKKYALKKGEELPKELTQ